MLDSFGRSLAEGDFGGGDAGAAGADGSAGDGAPIVGATVTVVDNAGHSVSAVTDTAGYFRVSVKGFTPPFIAKVVRADGSFWYSPSVAPVKTRGFVTLNITGLTDYVAYLVSSTAGKSASAQLTPALLAANTAALTQAKTDLSVALASDITAVGLSPSTFDPVTLAFRTDSTGYDKLLDRLSISNTPSSATVIVKKYALGGPVSGLGVTGLVLANAAKTYAVPAGATSWAFPVYLLAGTSYNVTIQSQPAGTSCSLVNASGTMGSADVVNVGLSCASAPPAASGTVTTLAGGTSAGFLDATGTSALFNSIAGVTVDGAGNVYVADVINYLIRKITPAGVVTTLAGSRSAGLVNGVGSAASFDLTSGVAVDSSGNVYVADSGNNVVRKVTSAGVVSTFAGGAFGYAEGSGTAASFRDASSVAVDAAGNVFVTDVGNHAIRKITPSGVVSTLAGNGSAGFVNGTGSAASFNNPEYLAVDAAGNVFVADLGNNVLRKVTPAGVVTTFATAFSAKTSPAPSLGSVAVDGAGNVYVIDYAYGVRKVSATGVVTSFADGVKGALAVDSAGYVYVGSSNRVLKISP